LEERIMKTLSLSAVYIFIALHLLFCACCESLTPRTITVIVNVIGNGEDIDRLEELNCFDCCRYSHDENDVKISDESSGMKKALLTFRGNPEKSLLNRERALNDVVSSIEPAGIEYTVHHDTMTIMVGEVKAEKPSFFQEEMQ